MIATKLMAGVMAGLMTMGTFAPVWADPPDNRGTGATATRQAPSNDSRSSMGMLAPILTEPADHQADKRCTPGELYSSHDVVGDRDSCFLKRFDSGGATGGNSIPGVF
jgi:hypothetical protein